ncbi:hypothetical protein FOA52_005804 [Chlamydomonas sp. UWO 241]|nr:hypothetical protein FOA52_005804 [Chlamydomonas sp. UWO 241]
MLPIELLDVIIYGNEPKFVAACRGVCREWRGLRDLPSAMLEVHAPNDALMRAAKNATVDTFRILLDSIDTDTVDIYPGVLLDAAARAGNTPMCRDMLDARFWKAEANVSADVLFASAARSGSVDCCNLFIPRLETPFDTVYDVFRDSIGVGHGVSDAVYVLMLDTMRTVTEDEHWMHLLHVVDLAIVHGRLGVCKAIMASIRSIKNDLDKDIVCELMARAATNQPDICKFFCEHEGAKPCHRGGVALVHAASTGKTDLCTFLCDRERFGSARAKARISNSTALLAAAKGGHAETCKALVLCGADPRAKNSRALVAAFERGHLETCRVLMDLGANPHDVGLQNKGVYDLVASRKV